MDRPNIIICTADQLRPFELGCYGNSMIRTPNVDRLASEGIRFETAVSNYPVCMAARSVLISGQYNRTCTGGIGNICYPGRPGDFNMPEYPYGNRPVLKDTTLPEILRAGGYRTQAIGKWHIHSWPHDVGFDHHLIPRVHHCHTGQLFIEDGGPEFAAPGYSTDFEATRMEQFLEESTRSGSPFFLYYNIPVPHCPLSDAPAEFINMYRPEDVVLRLNVNSDVPLAWEDYWFRVYRYDFRYYGLHLPYTEHLPQGYSLRHLIAEYCGMVTWMDSMVGRMLNALDRTGLAENTIVVFTADHGDNLGSHGLVQKGGTNDESIRIPMILRARGRDGMAPAVNHSHVASLVDLAPTLLSLAQIETPAHLQGRDLSPLCLGRSSDAPREAFIETSRAITIRSPDHACTVPCTAPGHALAGQPESYFNLAKDPYQFNNLASGGPPDAGAEALIARLRAWHDSTPWMRQGENGI